MNIYQLILASGCLVAASLITGPSGLKGQSAPSGLAELSLSEMATITGAGCGTCQANIQCKSASPCGQDCNNAAVGQNFNQQINDNLRKCSNKKGNCPTNNVKCGEVRQVTRCQALPGGGCKKQDAFVQNIMVDAC